MVNVFVTGGAGFLGRHILREARTRHPDWSFTVYSRDEAKHAQVRADHPDTRFVLGDIQDRDHLTTAMMGHDLVIHAAALKYVPQAEAAVAETTAVNINGSRNVAWAAINARVERVVGISTDKACRATSVYGMTKRLMERIFQEADTITPTQFNCVRYGNVIGSTGSVIPLFTDLIRKGDVVRLTNPAMTRFWLSVREAVDLVFEALAVDVGGLTLIPRLGATDMRTVLDACARALDRGEPRVQVMGPRPGEKVHEDLLAPEEVPWADARGRARVMWLYPPTAVPLDLDHRPDGLYTSNTPDHHLSERDMVEMIRDAAEYD